MIRSELHVAKTAAVSKKGMVVAEHPLAAEAGATILAEGGNAVDAAVATAFAVGVVEPMMSGVGGGGAMLVHMADQGRTQAIDFLPRVPAGASADMYTLDPDRPGTNLFSWPAVKDDANIVGHRSVAVPGAVAGLCLVQERHGRLPLARVMEPAISFARDGYIADWYISATITALARTLTRFPEAARIFLPGGLPPGTQVRTYLPAEPLRQTDLADTLERIARGGSDEFYRGDTAAAIADDMAANDGVLSRRDLADYEPIVSDCPLVSQFRNMDLMTLPDPCGSTTAVQVMNMLETFDPVATGPHSARGLHLMIEAQRLAFLDRFAQLADADYAAVKVGDLTSKAYAERRASDIDQARAYPQARAAALGSSDAGCTTHLCAADEEGNMVTLTNTVGDLFGSYVVTPGTGVLLNDGMIWFDPVPDKLNSVAPRKRPLSNATLFLGFRDGQPALAVGSPGGRKVITAVLQSIVNHVEHGMDLQQAIALPRVHCEGPVAQVDDRIDPAALAELEAMGHRLERLHESYTTANFARPVGIARDEDGTLRSGVDVLRPAMGCGVSP